MINSFQQKKESLTKIPVIDDDPAIREVVTDYLSTKNFIPLQAEEGQAGFTVFTREAPDLVLLDLRLPGMDGLEVLSHLNTNSPETPVSQSLGKGTLKDAIDALKIGAWDYITKPINDMQVLYVAIQRVSENARLAREKDNYNKNLKKTAKRDFRS